MRSTGTMNNVIEDLESKIGSDVLDLDGIKKLEKDLKIRKQKLEKNLKIAEEAIPAKLEVAQQNVEKKYHKIEELLTKNKEIQNKLETFLRNTSSPLEHIAKKLGVIKKLENHLDFFTVLQTVEDLSQQLSKCKDDEQSVLLFSDLKEIYEKYINDSRCTQIRKAVHNWHNELKEKLGKQYDAILKSIQWPFTSAKDSQVSPDSLPKFLVYTKYLFLLQLPKENISESAEHELSLPIKHLVGPLKKRFLFHFSSNRETGRLDRPEWFLMQTLTWIKQHGPFIKSVVQPVAEKLQLKNVDVESEFCESLSNLAAERLYNVLQACNTKNAKSSQIDGDTAFAHAIDEALVFCRGYKMITGTQCHSVLGILTKAEMFVKWLAMEKKYATLKIDDMLSDDQWVEPISSGVSVGTSTTIWVPRGADWFTTMLKTIEDRYNELPPPGHRLQFLELQLELCEEWHIRLAQILSAAVSLPVITSPVALKRATAVINATHHTRSVLLQWAHSLHLLQLHYYRRQFQHFTELQHMPEPETEIGENRKDTTRNVSLVELEMNAEKMAEEAANESSDGRVLERNLSTYLETSILGSVDTTFFSVENESEDSGVFGQIPALLKYLRDSGLATLADHIMMEFKANIKEYKRTKWHAIDSEKSDIHCITSSLCKPLSALSTQLCTVGNLLAPPLSLRLKARVAHTIDDYLLREVVLESWWNSAGGLQFKFDVSQNLLPVFTSIIKANVNHLPKLSEACVVLNMEYNGAVKLRDRLSKNQSDSVQILSAESIRHLHPSEVSEILTRRTDLGPKRTSRDPDISQLF